MARMDSERASYVKVKGEQAKEKLAIKLSCKSGKELIIDEIKHREIADTIGISGKLMLRVGKNWQFHLGDIPEISDNDTFRRSLQEIRWKNKKLLCGRSNISWDNQLKQLKSITFWEKYFCKGNDIFCFSTNNFEYFFFNIHEMVDFFILKTEWRLLMTGRIKGDLQIADGMFRTILTVEYRNEPHKQCFVFGAHGGNAGIDLFLILLRNITHYHCVL